MEKSKSFLAVESLMNLSKKRLWLKKENMKKMKIFAFIETL